MLQVASSTIAYDQIYLRNKARDNIRSYIDEKLPEEYEKCLVGITSILKEAWNTSRQEDIDIKEKLSALSLAKDCYSMKLDLLTNAEVVNDAMRFVSANYNNNRSDNEGQKHISNHQVKEEEEQQPEPTTITTIAEEENTTATTTNQVFQMVILPSYSET